MSLRKKTLLLVILILLGLIAVLYAASQAILLRGFAQVEQDRVRVSVERVLEALHDDLATLNSKVGDWAVWDDTYFFVKDPSDEYVKSNLVDSTFAELKLNMMAFLRPSGEIVYGRYYDFARKKSGPIPENLARHLTPGNKLLKHKSDQSKEAGLLMAGDRPMMIVSRPILRSDGSGPASGILVAGYNIDGRELERLSRRTRLNISLLELDDPNLPRNSLIRHSPLPGNGPTLSDKLTIPHKQSILVRTQSDSVIAGYTLLRDLYAKPALALRIQSDRPVYQQGRRTLTYLIVSLAITALAFGLAIQLLLETVVLQRLRRINLGINEIGRSGDLTARLQVEGKDELGRLSLEINQTLQALERAQEETTRLAMAIEQVDETIIITDAQGVITYVNPAFERITGFSREEALGKKPSILKSGRHPRSYYRNMWTALNKGQTWQGQFINKKKDGTIYEEEAHITPVFDASGSIVNFVAVKWDVTKARQVERQSARAQKLEAIGELAAGVAHEINTPTQYIGDNIRFCLEGFQDLGLLFEKWGSLFNEACSKGEISPELAERFTEASKELDFDYLREEIPKALNASLNGVNQVATIVRAMKEFSHPGSGEKAPVDINKAIQNAITISRNEWKYVADIRTEFDAQLPQVPCLVGDFNQVMLNLIVNAAHAIADKTGESPRKKGLISISTRKVDDQVEIKIQDTGAGIPNYIRDKIFDPFFTTKSVGRGTGRGLAITHSVIVDRHQGSINFESEPGKGTTFIINLPLYRSASADRKPDQAVTGRPK